MHTQTSVQPAGPINPSIPRIGTLPEACAIQPAPVDARSRTAQRVPARHLAALAVALAAALGSSAAAAQTRMVIVNGVRLSDAQIARFDRQQCAHIPNGAYWVDPRSGRWGYQGNPAVQGIVGDGCLARDHDTRTNRDGTLGPFATMRRANEVAAQYRSRGQSVNVFHNGDGYYLRVFR